MPQFSLLARLQKPNPTLLRELIESLESQTYQDWELVLVGAGDVVTFIFRGGTRKKMKLEAERRCVNAG